MQQALLVKKGIKMIFNYNNKEYELIFLTKTGSRLYGNFTEDSDWDYRGIFIEKVEDKISIINKPLKKIGGVTEDGNVIYDILKSKGLNIEKTTDIEIYELSRFIELAMESNPNILDLLCSNINNAVYVNDLGKKLLENKSLFLSKKIKDSFSGYALSQLKKMNGHKKWIVEFPDTHIILKHLDLLYNDSKIDFDWISDNFGGQVALKITNENAQNKKSILNTISWNDFEKHLILSDENINPNKYRMPRLINYCYPKDIKGKVLKKNLDVGSNEYIKEFPLLYDMNVTFEDFLYKYASFRDFSPSMLSIFTGGNGIFTKEGGLRASPPKNIDEHVCFLSIDQIKFKSDRDYINKMWNWKCNRNEMRSKLEDQYGYDLKHASHLVRLLDACEEVLKTNNYTPELSGYRLQKVKDIREGKYTYDEVLKYAEDKERFLSMIENNLNDLDLEKIEKLYKELYFENQNNKLDLSNKNI